MGIFNGTKTQTSLFLGDLNAEMTKDVLFVLYYILWPILIICGISGNVLNIIVFVEIGLKESMTVSLLTLSLSDLSYLVLSAGITVGANIAISPISRVLNVSMYTLAGYMTSYQRMALYTSMGITTYVAVARCCCVAMPLKFRHVFTFRRTIFILCLITLICIVSRIPYLSQLGFMWIIDSRTNSTRLTGWYSDNYQSYRAAKNLLNQTIYPFTVLGIVSVCSAILLNALIRASRLRHEMTGDHEVRRERKKDASKDLDRSDISVAEKEQRKLTRQDTDTGDSTLSAKEVRVVQAVVLVTLFLLLTVLIMSAKAIAQFIVPEIAPGDRLINLNNLISSIEQCIAHINASVNVVIYYNFNFKFRETIRTMFKDYNSTN